MQPGMAGLYGAVWQQLVVGVLASTAAEAAAGRGADRIPVQPFDNGAVEGSRLRLPTWQSTIDSAMPARGIRTPERRTLTDQPFAAAQLSSRAVVISASPEIRRSRRYSPPFHHKTSQICYA